MKFKEYLSEAITSSATNMEMAIVQVWNDYDTQYKDLKEVAISICDYLEKGMGISGKAFHMGAESLPLNKNWSKYGGIDRTPKTDLIIGNYKISLKKTGGSQLVSGSKKETSSILYSVAEELGIFEDVKSKFDEYIQELAYNKRAEIKQTVTSLRNSGDKDIKLVDEMHKNLTIALNNYFKTNSLYRRGIIKETITGNNKFGKSSDGSATHVLIYNDRSLNHRLYSVDDESFISHISSSSDFQFSFKSMVDYKTRTRVILSNLRIHVNEDSIGEGIFKDAIAGLNDIWKSIKRSFFNMRHRGI